jgi:hypothetical protein
MEWATIFVENGWTTFTMNEEVELELFKGGAKA